MNDTYWQPVGARPPGALEVSIMRPPMRFGSWLYVTVVNSEGRWIAEVVGSTLRWRKYNLGIEDARPTLPLLDDDITAALFAALKQQGVRARGQATVDHLEDAIQMRDTFLGMIKAEWDARTEGRP